MRRTTAGGVVVTVVAVAAVGGLIAGSRSESPAEVALRTAPPKPSPILVPVERRTLTSDVVTRGTGTFGAPQKLTVASSTLKPTPGILAAVAPVGTQLPEGSVAASVSGRPIFVLVGPNPMARDLGPGLVGDDVRQLEESLVRLGFDPGRADGVYDAGTESGVAALYASQGFAPFTATLEQLATVRARASEQAAALVEVYAATDAAGADHAALSTARIEQRSAVVRAATARRSLAQVQAEATAANRLAEAELSLKRNTVDSLRRSVVAPTVSVAEPGPATSSGATPADIAMAERELAVAQANQETIRLSGVRSIDIAMVAIADADSDVDLRTVSVGSAAAGVNMSALTVSARSSVEDLASKAQGLASRVAGVQVPADEVVFVAAGPVRVSELLVGVGDTATGSIMKVTDSVVHVDAGLALGDVALVRSGMSVKIEESDLGIAADGTLVEVAPAPGTNGVDGFHVYARIDVASAPPTLVGASVRLTIPVKSTTGDALAVPVSAVTLSGDGSSKVQVERGGKLLPVAVEALLSAGGYVAIQPVGAPLREGDLVVIGTHPAAKPRATGK